MIKLILKLLQKIISYQNKRKLLKRLKPIGYNIKFQCMDELKETGNIPKKSNIKLKDGTKVSLTDKKKEKGSLSWTW